MITLIVIASIVGYAVVGAIAYGITKPFEDDDPDTVPAVIVGLIWPVILPILAGYHLVTNKHNPIVYLARFTQRITERILMSTEEKASRKKLKEAEAAQQAKIRNEGDPRKLLIESTEDYRVVQEKLEQYEQHMPLMER